MPKYLATIHLPDDFDPSTEDEATVRDIYALDEEMDAAGVTVFACGLAPASCAKSLRPQPMARCWSPTGPSLRPRSTWAVFR